MCSISGSVNHSEMFVIEANKHQAKRGPDHSGILRINQNTFFSHSLLSIIGHQTQPIESIRYVMVFNGCIYNYKDLYPYETSDTSALLKHIESKGFKEALNDLNGMFAIAVYDKLQNKIYCACDRFNQKPLYYHHESEKFAFASTPAALLTLKDKWTIDEDALQSYWLLGSCMGSDSIWTGIKKLCASEMLEYDCHTNELTISRYYEPKFMYNALNQIEDLVYDAIDKVKIADVPVNIFLSGGIDSTLVASRFQGYEAIHLDSPEYKYAKEVADKFDIRLRCLSPETIEAEAVLTDFAYQCGEPMMAAMIPYITAKEASKYSKVAITANGSDEIMYGYNRTHENITEEQLTHTYRSIQGPKFMHEGHEIGYPFYTKFNGKSHGSMWELGGYVQFDLNKTLDFASGCHGLEVRSPFLDHRLVECALSIPEQVHRNGMGNKTLLKKMLLKMGFSNEFVMRPKLGFSIHYQPEGLPKLKSMAVTWCINNRFLKLNFTQFGKLSPRDQQYLEMSCLSFFYWFKVWENKIL